MQLSIPNSSQSVLLYLLRLGLSTDSSVPVLSVESPDWEVVSELAVRQEVLAFVFDGFVRLYESGPTVPEMPLALKKKWIGTVYQIEVDASEQQRKAQRMAQLFKENSIRTYVLKGQVIAECYPKPAHRLSADLDCFLLPSDGSNFNAWESGNVLMEEKGFKVSRGFYKNSSFRMKGWLVENHRYMTPFRGNKRLEALEVHLQELIRSDEGLDKFDGVELYRPPVMFSALFLIEHAYSHFLHEGLTLKHLTDWVMFRRRHEAEIDWDVFNVDIDSVGLRRFYEAYTHVGEFIIGEREALSEPEQRMMDSVWEGLDLHDTVKGVKGKLNLVGNTLRAAWKYRYFSPISMIHALWIQVKGVLFDRHPRLDL